LFCLPPQGEEKEGDMKKNSKIKKAKENLEKMKVVKDRCSEIFYAFECPGGGEIEGPELSILTDEITPWQDLVTDTIENSPFTRLFDALKVSFAMGYVIGQMLDVPEIDTTPIQELLREKKSLLYLPHKKKAA